MFLAAGQSREPLLKHENLAGEKIAKRKCTVTETIVALLLIMSLYVYMDLTNLGPL